eukprot:1925760-Pleurochrysis_carterae.AAC.1
MELVRPILTYMHSQCFNVDDSTKVLADRRPSKPCLTTMNDRAAAARKAARLGRGDDETADDPTCAHHAITNIFE